MSHSRRKILLIMAAVPGYREEIARELSIRGDEVHILEGCGKPKSSLISKKQRVTRSLVYDFKLWPLAYHLGKMEKRFYVPLVDLLADDYDYVFDFGGHAQESCLKILRERLSSRFLLYLWDDVGNIPKNRQRFRYFDEIFSFSPDDSKKFGFNFRPSFFHSDFSYHNEDKEIEIFYKGTLRERKRALFIDRITKFTDLQKNDISLYTPKGYLSNLFRVPNKKFFDTYCNSEYLSANQISIKTKHSKAILDIAFKDQKGLSPRIFEAIAANCKIITTNKNIIDYDIYNQNVFVIEEDEGNLSKIPSFIATEFEPYPKAVLTKYSLPGFLDELFHKP